MKTSTLTRPALDWAVAKCEGRDFTYGALQYSTSNNTVWARGGSIEFSPSTSWAQGGPIIEREKIGTWSNPKDSDDLRWCASKLGIHPWAIERFGPTLLIAAMRCLVTSRLGDEVDVPKELL